VQVFVFFLLAFISAGYLVRGIYLRCRYVKLGRPDMRDDHPGQRWKNFFTNIILQRKVWNYPFFALCHIFVVSGFLILLIGMPNMVAEGLFNAYIPYIGDNYGYQSVKDVFNMLIIVGVLGMLARRLIKKPQWLKNNFTAFAKLGLIFSIVLSEIFFHGARHAWGQGIPLLKATPLVIAVSQVFAGSNAENTYVYMMVLWWLHFLAVFAFCFLIPNSSHLHLVFAPFNAYWYTLAPKGALRKIPGDGKSFNANTLEGLTWKQLFDAYTCVKCGRCNGRCPAQLSGEDLKPKGLNARLRKHIEIRAPKLLKKKTEAQIDAEAAATKSKAKKGKKAGNSKSQNKLVKEAYDEKYIWSCTTCGACTEVCPVSTEHLAKMIDLRRHLVLAEGDISAEMERFFAGIAEQGNPWGRSRQGVPAWAAELGVPAILKKPGTEYLYYAGCAAAFEPTAQKTAAAFVRILQAAKVDFGMLGNLDWCCGETARRLGNEGLFEKAARFNIDTWRKLGIKKIITTCPHCFNTLKNEYPQFGGEFEVIHHADFLTGLLREGKFRAGKAFAKTVTFHDPCYLGRYNDLFRQPRAVLQAVPAVQLREMPRTGKESFCCGAGGGRIWTMPTPENPITGNRFKEAVATGVEVIGTACPYCKKVFAEAAGSAGVKIEVLDIVEIFAESVE